MQLAKRPINVTIGAYSSFHQYDKYQNATTFSHSPQRLEKKKSKAETSPAKIPITGGKVKEKMNTVGYGGAETAEHVRRHHKHDVADNQCSSLLIKHIKAPVHLVWSLVRRFDQPQKYKPFINRCVVHGKLEKGSLREVGVKSGLPATTSTERLELLDDNEHILSIRIIGGDHRLKNYSSIVSLHPEIIDGRAGTMVIESFVVDVPEGNTKDETCFFVEALINCNLKSLADVSELLLCRNGSSQ